MLTFPELLLVCVDVLLCAYLILIARDHFRELAQNERPGLDEASNF